MKRILGLSITALAIALSANAFNANALNEPKASKFQYVSTRAKLKFKYDTETLEASNIQIKFGGKFEAINFNDKAEHGVIVIPGSEYNTLNNENHLLDINEFNKLNDKKYILSFTNQEIGKETVDDIDYMQYAWVLNQAMPYDYEFAAAMYEKMGDVVTLAKPCKHSVGTLVNSYMFNNDVDIKIKEVISKYSDKAETKVEVKLDENQLKTTLVSGSVPADGKFKVFTHGWNSNYAGSEGLVEATYDKENKCYIAKTSPKNDRILYLLMPEDATQGNYDNNLAKSKDLYIHNKKILDINQIDVTYDNVTAKFAGRINNTSGINILGKPLYAWVWKYNENGHFVKVDQIHNTLTTTKDMTCVKFVYMKEDKPEWGENNSNVLLESEEMALRYDEYGFYKILLIKEDRILSSLNKNSNTSYPNIDKGQYKLWARCWNDTRPNDSDYWYEASYDKLEISNRYDHVIFVLKDKNDGPGFDGKKAQTRDYKIENGYVLYD